MTGRRVILGVVVLALLNSLLSLRLCFKCASKSVRKASAEKYREDDGLYESTVSAGFLPSSNLHTINIEGAEGHVNCGAACSLGLRLNCSESGRTECATILRTPAKSAVVFDDLKAGDYIVTVTCDDFEESETSCYAEPEELVFPVQLPTPKSELSFTEVPSGNIKLYRKFTGQCSNFQVWRSRLSCLAILYTLVGVALLLISLPVRCEDEVMPSNLMPDVKWVLQARRRP